MIAVTGATGTIGSELVRILAEEEVPFRALTRDPERARARLGPGVQAWPADLARPDTLDPALEGAEALFLLTAVSDELGRLEANLVDAAGRAGVRRIVKLSALGAHPESPMRLGREHGRSEVHLADSGISHTLLRPGSYMQNLLVHAPTIRDQGALYAAYGDGRVALIDARDVAEVAARLLGRDDGHDGSAHVLTGPEPIGHHRVAVAIAEGIGKPVSYVPISSQQAGEALRSLGLPSWLVEDLTFLAELAAAGEAELVTDEVRRWTGRPARPIEVFARDYAAAFQD